MNNYIQKMLGVVTVTEENDIITVTGVSGKNFYRDFNNLWRTTRVGNYIFLTFNNSSFSFHSFFLPDILFNINTLIEGDNKQNRIRTLSKIRDKLMAKTWINQTNSNFVSKLNYKQLDKFNLTPLDFQSEFFDLYDKLTQWYRLNGFLFAGSAGSGKTYSALALAYCLEVESIIVICPKNATRRVWEDTILTKIKDRTHYYISSLHQSRTGRETISIYHYEDLPKAIDTIDELRTKKTAIILDESHNLNEVTTLRTNLFINLCKGAGCKEVIWLSGTPIKALSKETVPLFRCIDPLFTLPVEESFKRIFRGDSGKAVEILNNRLGLVSFVVPKARLNLKDPIIESVYITTPNSEAYTLESLKVQMARFINARYAFYRSTDREDRAFFYSCIAEHQSTLKSEVAINEFEHYKLCLQTIINTTAYFAVRDEIVFCNKYELTTILPTLSHEKRNRFKTVKSIIKYLPLKIKGECLGKVIGAARIACYVELANVLDYDSICESTEKKTIVFTSYVEVLQAANKRSIEQGLTPVLVYGATNNKLSSLLGGFEKDDNLNPLIATFDSLSTAVPLVMCDTMIMINVPFRDYELQQAISRIHRLGATSQTRVYTVFLDTGNKPNISTRSKDILEWSQEQVEKIMGIKSPFKITNDADISNLNITVEGYIDEVPIFMSW
mgnify:CR=1 FL=1